MPKFSQLIDLRTMISIVVLSVSLILTGSACTKKNSQNKAEPGTFVFRISSEPPNVDPAKGVDNISIDIMNNVMEGLTQFDRNMKILPALAESWEISKDNKTYTFKIRQGVLWSDGVPFKARHVVESWERMLNPSTGAEYAYFLFDIDQAESYNSGKLKDFSKVGVKALDDHTLQVKLQRPASYWLSLTAAPAMFPVRKDVIEKVGERWTEPEHFVTVGPYRITEWQHDQRLVLERNEKYWGPKPHIKKAVAQIIEEVATAISLFEAGQIDLVRRIPPNEIARFEKTDFFGKQPYLRGYYYGFNVTKKPFHDVRVRKAFAHAIDREELPKILKGGQLAVTSWIPKGMLGFNPDVGLKFDPVRAKKYLADAGFPNGKGFPRAKMAFDVREDNRVIAESIQQMWKKHLGVDLEIQTMEYKVYLDSIRADSTPIFRHGWGADFPDPHNFMDLFLSNSGNNHTRWKSPKYDQAVKRASGERDPIKRVALYDEAQRIMLEEDVAIIPLFNETVTYLLQPRVKDFSLDGMANLFLRFYRVE